MSRLVNTLAEQAGMQPDEYVESLRDPRAPDGPREGYPDSEAEWVSGPKDSSGPQTPAADKLTRHDRRRYSALNRRIQVR